MAKLQKNEPAEAGGASSGEGGGLRFNGAARASRVRQGRVLVNSTSSMVAQLVAMAIGLWFTPFLVHRLGVEVYGVVPLTLLVISYFALVTNSINVFVGRDFSAAFARGDRSRAERIYSTAMFLNLVLGGGCMVVGLGLAPFAATIFHVPTGLERAAQGLFAATAVGFFLTCLATVSSSVLFGHNRLDLRAGVSVLSNLVRVGVVVAAFGWLGPSLHWMSWSLVVAALVAWGAYHWVARRLERRLQFRRLAIDSALVRSYWHEGGWVLLNQLGSILYLKIDLLVVNWFMGAAASGRYALALQWSNVMRSLSGTITGAFAPTIMMRAGLGDLDGVVRFARHAIRMVGILLALLVGGLCGFTRPLLEVWLGAGFSDLAPLLVVLTSHLAVNIAVSPLFAVQVATGKVKVPGMVTFGMGVVNLLLALAVAGLLGWGAMGVAVAGAVVLLAKNALFTPWYAARITGQRWHVFLQDVVRVVMATGGVWAVAFGVSSVYAATDWAGLALGGVATTLVCAPWCWWLYLTGEDRQQVRERIRQWMHRAPRA